MARLERAARLLSATRKPVPREQKLSRQAVLTLAVHVCFQLGASMSGVFLNLYLWRLTHSLYVSASYQLIFYALAPFVFMLGGYIAKKRNVMQVYRLSIVLTGLFYLAVIAVNEAMVGYYALFAVFNTLANSLYWTAYLTLMYDVTTDRNRFRFVSFNTVFFTLATLTGPALAGWIINRNDGLDGYITVFAISFALFALTAVGSFRMREVTSRHKTYYLKYTGALMRRSREWTKALIAFFIYGLFQGVMLFLPTIMLYWVVSREDLVGYLGVLFSGLTVVVGLLMSRYARADRIHVLISVAAAFYVACSLPLVWEINFLTVMLFMVLYSIGNPLQGNSLTNHYYAFVGKLPLKQNFRIESVVVRELFLNMGRVVSIGLLVLLSLQGGFESGLLPLLLLTAACAQFAVVRLVKAPK